MVLLSAPIATLWSFSIARFMYAATKCVSLLPMIARRADDYEIERRRD
ncbi:MAG: hypothetical protein R3F14_34100 [Polyangiaceae bacterium]